MSSVAASGGELAPGQETERLGPLEPVDGADEFANPSPLDRAGRVDQEHLEILVSGEPIDPIDVLPPRD